jgi:glyoxylase-like metal-dependent hydrolase (beta-lactamase superfamily II)
MAIGAPIEKDFCREAYTRPVTKPHASDATVTVLLEGSGSPRVRSSCTLVRDGDAVVVVDPGMAPSQRAILDPLLDAGVDPAEVTDVVVSHHHPDHTVNVGLFGEARVHDHWATYHFDTWTSRPAEGFAVSPSVLLWETPGHTPQDITTLIGTGEGLVVCTHLWWYLAGPVDDPVAVDNGALHAGRRRVLAVEPSLIIPGHGPPFTPADGPPN